MASSVAEILGSFSTNQLRDLALAMGPHGVDSPKRVLGKEQLLGLLDKKKSDQTLALFAHRIEAITPYKHLFVYSLDSPNSEYAKMKARVDAAFPKFIGGFREVDPAPWRFGAPGMVLQTICRTESI